MEFQLELGISCRRCARHGKKGKDPDVGILKMTIFCFSKLALHCNDCNF